MSARLICFQLNKEFSGIWYPCDPPCLGGIEKLKVLEILAVPIPKMLDTLETLIKPMLDNIPTLGISAIIHAFPLHLFLHLTITLAILMIKHNLFT